MRDEGPTYRLGRHPRRTDHPALLHTNGQVAHTFAYDANRDEIIASLEHAGFALHADDSVTPDGDTPKEGGEIAATFAALEVLTDAPTALDLGRQLANAERAYHAFDSVVLRQGTSRTADDGIDARSILEDRLEALRTLISTTPARSLQDAAVLVAEAAIVAGRVAESNFDKMQIEEFLARLERMLVSAAPLIAKAAGLDPTEMEWAHRDYVRLSRFAGVGVQS